MKNVKAFPWRPNPVQLLGFCGALEQNTLTLRSPFAIFEP